MADGIRWDLVAGAGKDWVDSFQRGRETHFDNQAREVLNPSGPGLLQRLVGGVVPGTQQPAGGSILSQLVGISEAPQQAPQRFDPNNPTPEQLAVLMQSSRFAPMAAQLMQQKQQQTNTDRQQRNWQAGHNLQVRQFNRGDTPQGFEPDPTNPTALRPRTGGPADPNYVRAITDAKPNKVPFGIQNAEAEDLSSVQGLNTINSELQRFDKLIADGKLNLTAVQNIGSRVRNAAGFSDENSRNFASFNATLEKLRNESLRLNKGVQTEGDAIRAWNELIANPNDTNLVRQRLAEIQVLNQRAADFKRNLIVQRREDNRLPPLDFERVLTPQSNSTNQHQQFQDGDTATGPNGARMQFRGGRWVPMR